MSQPPIRAPFFDAVIEIPSERGGPPKRLPIKFEKTTQEWAQWCNLVNDQIIDLENAPAIGLVTTSAPGLAPTLPGDATLFLNGEGGYTSPNTVMLPTQDLSGGTLTLVDFDIPAGARRIVIGSPAHSNSGTSINLLQLGTSAGVENTGYVSTAWNGVTSNITLTGFIMAVSQAAASFYNTVATLDLIDEDTNTWVLHGFGMIVTGATIDSLTGVISLPGELTTIRWTTENGTDLMDAGAVSGAVSF